jgi:hypothetical protein
LKRVEGSCGCVSVPLWVNLYWRRVSPVFTGEGLWESSLEGSQLVGDLSGGILTWEGLGDPWSRWGCGILDTTRLPRTVEGVVMGCTESKVARIHTLLPAAQVIDHLLGRDRISEESEAHPMGRIPFPLIGEVRIGVYISFAWPDPAPVSGPFGKPVLETGSEGSSDSVIQVEVAVGLEIVLQASH